MINPQRDIVRIEAALAARHLRCVLVAVTSIHSAYVSGGYQLVKKTGAACAHDDGDFTCQPGPQRRRAHRWVDDRPGRRAPQAHRPPSAVGGLRR